MATKKVAKLGSVWAIKDEGPYQIYSTILLPDLLSGTSSESGRDRIFFGYSIGGQVPGAAASFPASRLETNMRVASQFVDETMRIRSIDLAIPCVSRAEYQIDPAGGPYTVSEKDVAAIAATYHSAFYVGGDKPFVESNLHYQPFERRGKLPQRDGYFFLHGGGWITRLGEFDKKRELPVGRIEKFWGMLSSIRGVPIELGQHRYNKAIVPVTMILNVFRTRAVQ